METATAKAEELRANCDRLRVRTCWMLLRAFVFACVLVGV